MIFDEAVFMHVYSDDVHENLLLFLILVLNFQTPQVKISDFFIKKYLSLKGIEVKFKYYALDREKQDWTKNPETRKKVLELLGEKEEE